VLQEILVNFQRRGSLLESDIGDEIVIALMLSARDITVGAIATM